MYSKTNVYCSIQMFLNILRNIFNVCFTGFTCDHKAVKVPFNINYMNISKGSYMNRGCISGSKSEKRSIATSNSCGSRSNTTPS